MAKRKLIIPNFASEAEDAQWHDRQRRELERALERRIREGSTSTLQQVAARVKLRPAPGGRMTDAAQTQTKEGR